MEEITHTNIRSLLHSRGKRGLHQLVKRVGRSLVLRNIKTQETYMRHANSCTAIGSWWILKLDGSKIDAVKALENIYDWIYEDPDNPRTPKKNNEQMLPIICPEYNPLAFKHYHVPRLLDWFDSLDAYFRANPPAEKTEEDLIGELET